MTEGADPGNSADGAEDYFPGERRRVVPKAAWLVLAIALATLLVLLVSRPSWFTHDIDDQSLRVPADRHFSKSLASAGDPDGIWLSDENPSRTFAVRLPVDVDTDQARLRLVGSSRVPDTSTAFLSVSVNGQLIDRAKIASGDDTIDRYVEIPDGATGDGELRIRIFVDGERHEERCSADHSAGMLVHLDPASLVEAALSAPVASVRDAVAGWGRAMVVAVGDHDPAWLTAAAQVGMALTRHGYGVEFTDAVPDADARDTLLVGPANVLSDRFGWTGEGDGRGPLEVGRIGDSPVVAVTAPQGALAARFLGTPTVITADSPSSAPTAVAPAQQSTGDRVGVEVLGADLSATTITETRTWRVPFALADLPGGRIPSSSAVSVELPASPDDITWILTTELNGVLVGNVPLNPTRGEVRVPLPATAMRVNNSLAFTVSRDRNLGGCDVRVTEYPIQLNQASALEIGDDRGVGFTAVPQQLSAGAAVYVPGPGSEDVIAVLNRSVPVVAEFVAAQVYPDFRWNTAPDGRDAFIVLGDADAVSTPLVLRDGRLISLSFGSLLDVPSFSEGLLVQTARGDAGGRGLSLTGAGAMSAPPNTVFGRTDVEVITAQGRFTVEPDGAVVTESPPRQSPR